MTADGPGSACDPLQPVRTSGLLSCSSSFWRRNPFQRARVEELGLGIAPEPLGAAPADQARPGGRSGAAPSIRHQPHLSARSLHPALPDQRHHGAPPPRARDRGGLGLVAVALRPHDDRGRPGQLGPRGPRLLLRPARPVLGREGGPPGDRRDGRLAGRDGLRSAVADARRSRGHHPLVHADLRPPPARGGGGAAPRIDSGIGGAGALHRRTGWLAARSDAPGSRRASGRSASIMPGSRRRGRSETRASAATGCT